MKSKIWLYQTNKPLVGSLAKAILNHVNEFATNWQAHGKNLDAEFYIHNPYLLVCAVNEDVWSASGCSIDKKVQFLKDLGEQFNIDFFVRMKTILEMEDGSYEQMEFSEVKHIRQNFKIFNPTVASGNERAKLFTDIEDSPMKRLLA
jgi:hypothetical protein